MDEGKRVMVKPGWQSKYVVFFSSVMALLTSWSVFANPLTVRDINVANDGKIAIQFDANVSKKIVDVEFVRDVVQFSIKNATLYPAKIIHTNDAQHASFTKLFAYQYSPSLVRIRLSVDGNASDFKKTTSFSTQGKSMVIRVSEGGKKSAISAAKEQSLLSRVLGSSSKTEEPVAKVEEKKNTEERTAASSNEAEKPLGKKKKAAPVVANNNDEEQQTLGGAHSGPSVFRSFMAMFLVVGGLGLVLLYLKQKKNSTQATRRGDSWISGLLGGAKTNRALIEVISSQSIGPKQSITVIRIRDQQFVLAVSESSVQLITQLDSDDLGIDVLDDPKVVDSIGKMFGSKPVAETKPAPAKAAAQTQAPLSSFQAMAKSAYQVQSAPDALPPIVRAQAPSVTPGLSARDKIRQSLNLGGRS